MTFSDCSWQKIDWYRSNTSCQKSFLSFPLEKVLHRLFNRSKLRIGLMDTISFSFGFPQAEPFGNRTCRWPLFLQLDEILFKTRDMQQWPAQFAFAFETPQKNRSTVPLVTHVSRAIRHLLFFWFYFFLFRLFLLLSSVVFPSSQSSDHSTLIHFFFFLNFSTDWCTVHPRKWGRAVKVFFGSDADVSSCRPVAVPVHFGLTSMVEKPISWIFWTLRLIDFLLF